MMEINATHNSTTNKMGSRTAQGLEPAILWYWILRSAISFLTVLGNGIIIYLITTKRRLRTKSNWFVLSLAVADFSIGAFVTPSGLLCSFWVRCEKQLQIVFYNSLLFVSTTALWVLTLDRYIAIVNPLRYVDIMTDLRCKVFIVLSWICPVAVSTLRLALIYTKTKGKLEQAYRLTMDLLFGFVSCLVLSLAYTRILCLIRKHVQVSSRQRTSVSFNQPSAESASSDREREKAWAKVLGLVVLLFVCCYGLSVKISFCLNFDLCTVSPETALAAILLVHLNSATNFAVYAVFKKDIRRELLRLCRKPWT